MDTSPNGTDQKLSRSVLIALVVGPMARSGIVALLAWITWIIAGVGVLMSALVGGPARARTSFFFLAKREARTQSSGRSMPSCLQRSRSPHAGIYAATVGAISI